MKLYRVDLCLILVISRLKKFNLFEYNTKNPIIFVQASDPDDACYKTIHNLATIIFKQNSSAETVELFNELKHDIKIKKVIIPNEEKF
jgi:hypothetical protein